MRISLSTRRTRTALHTGLALLLIASCSSGPEFSGAADGTEQAPCRAGRQCDAGLVCLSNLCVESNENDDGSGGAGTANEGGNRATAGSDMVAGKSGSDQGAAGEPGLGGAGVIGVGGSAVEQAGSGQEGGMAGAPSVECTVGAPTVLSEPSRRGCSVGECYCSFDACYPEATAAACCGQTPVCAAGGETAEVDCSGKHPIIGPPRTCEPGFCLCSKAQVIDVCLPKDAAPYCCPEGVELKCVADSPMAM